MDQNIQTRKNIYQGPFCKTTVKAVKNANSFTTNRKNCIEKLVLKDKNDIHITLETIKLIFKSSKFSSQEKFISLMILRDLIESLNQFVVEGVKKILLSRMYQMVTSVPKGSWSKCSEILFPVSKDKDKKWGLRFYVFLTEILQRLAQEIQPFDEQTGKKSAFSMLYKKLQETNLTKQEYIYYDCNLENLSELDRKFFSIFNIDGNTPIKTKNTTNKNIIQNSIIREQDELLNKVRIARKDFLNMIFQDEIISDELLKSKELYQQIVLQYFEKMEHQFEKQSQNENSIKEMELADNLFEIYDDIFPNDLYTSNSIKQFKTKACSVLLQIFGGYPEKYQQAVTIEPFVQSPKKVQNFSIKKQNENSKIQSLSDSKKYLVRNIHQRPKIQRNNISEREEIRKQNEAQLLKNKNRGVSQTSINNQRKPKIVSVGHTKVLDEKKMIKKLILKEYEEKEDQYTRMKEKYDLLRKQYEEKCYQEYYNNQGKKEENIEKITQLLFNQKTSILNSL